MSLFAPFCALMVHQSCHTQAYATRIIDLLQIQVLAQVDGEMGLPESLESSMPMHTIGGTDGGMSCRLYSIGSPYLLNLMTIKVSERVSRPRRCVPQVMATTMII